MDDGDIYHRDSNIIEKLTEAKEVLLDARDNLNQNWRKELVKYESAYAYFNLLSAKKREDSYDTLSKEEKDLEEKYLAQAEKELEDAEEDLAKKAPAEKENYEKARDEYNMLYEKFKLARRKFLELETQKSDAENLLEINSSKVGGKRKSKGNSKKVSKKPVVSQKKQSECKEILGKKMKIYKMPDSRKEYVKYKGELHHIADYKNLMKQKAIAKTKTKAKTNK